jgi:hypothetical protein
MHACLIVRQNQSRAQQGGMKWHSLIKEQGPIIFLIDFIVIRMAFLPVAVCFINVGAKGFYFKWLKFCNGGTMY